MPQQSVSWVGGCVAAILNFYPWGTLYVQTDVINEFLDPESPQNESLHSMFR